MSSANLNIDIRKYLPHRGSMLLIDKLISLDNETVETSFRIEKDNIFLENSTFTEVGLIENMAQTCSIIVGSDYFTKDNKLTKNDSDVLGFISNIKSIRILKSPKINDTIISKGKLISRFDGDDYTLCTMTGSTMRDDEILVQCELKLMIKKVK